METPLDHMNADIGQQNEINGANVTREGGHFNDSGNIFNYHQSQNSTVVHYLSDPDQNQFSIDASNPNSTPGDQLIFRVIHIESLNTQHRMEMHGNAGQFSPNSENDSNIPRSSVITKLSRAEEIIRIDEDHITKSPNEHAIAVHDDVAKMIMLPKTNFEANSAGILKDQIQRNGQEVSCTQHSELINLISDDEEYESTNVNIAACTNAASTKDNENGDCEAQPPSKQCKRKAVKSISAAHLKRKRKLAVTVDAVERSKSEFCEFSTETKSDLTKHVRTHSDEKPFECEFCAKRVSSQRTLGLHMKTHANMFAFHCSKCRRGFSYQNEWESHKKCCKAKLLECYLCKEKFYRQNFLATHIQRIHIGEKRFNCSDCPKMFFSKHKLKIHTICHNTNAN